MTECVHSLHFFIPFIFSLLNYMPKETKNKSFILRVDPKTMEALEKWAADEFRSVNGQILFVLDQALKKAGRAPKKM